jgi:microcystin-dependent protein
LSQLALPNNIEVDTTADAIEVEQNYQVIEQFVNSQLINRDGSISMAAPLLLVGDPTAERHAATKSYVDNVVPVGVVMLFAGGAVPAGRWFLCNGAVMTATSWPELFAVLGYKYGGSASSFNLPNLAGRFPIGVQSTDTRFDTIGETGGTFEVPVPQHLHAMPHTHPINHDHGQINTGSGGDHNHQGRFSSGAGLAAGGTWYAHRLSDISGTVASQITGQSGSHEHTVNLPAFTGNSGAVSTANTDNTGEAGVDMVQPYIVLNYIIKADPV